MSSEQTGSAYRNRGLVAPMRSWTLSTSGTPTVAMALFAILAVAAPVWFLSELPSRILAQLADARLLAMTLLTAVPGLIGCAVVWWGRDADSVVGGRAELRLFDENLEVPRPRRGGTPHDVFELKSLAVRVDHVRVRVNFILTNEIMVAVLRDGERERRLSSRLFVDMQELQSFVEDVRRAQRGEPLAPNPGRANGRRDAYDDRLDEELAALDD